LAGRIQARRSNWQLDQSFNVMSDHVAEELVDEAKKKLAEEGEKP
jgi:hypothetical protein